MDRSSTSRGHAVLVSSPGMGHLNPFLALANRLSSLHSFKVTVLYVNSGHASVTAGGEQHSDVNLVNIPAAGISNKVEPGAHLVSRICIMMRETAPAIRAAILGLSPTVLVFGMFATEYLSIGREMGLPSFVFINSARLLALTVYCPVLDKEVKGEYVDQAHPLVLPGGCTPVRPEDVVDPMLKRSEPQYAEYLRMGVQFPLFEGVLVTTWQDLEGSTLTALRDPGSILPIAVYDIGPITAVVEPNAARTVSDQTMLMEWLDRQPAQSVIYITFGSNGTLSAAQMKELALGLELSQQRFIWVVRPPTDVDGDPCAAYFGLKADVHSNDTSLYLPPGFEERTRDVGWLVHQWAPQSKLLSHPSLGGFLTQCGWNSVLESLTNGVPMLAWPMFADQKLNATLAVEELKVAIRAFELPAEKLVGREEIGRKVRELILEGRPMRLRAQELKKSAAQSLTPTGSSYKRLSEFVQTAIHLADTRRT